jgi:hypothetical protein
LTDDSLRVSFGKIFNIFLARSRLLFSLYLFLFGKGVQNEDGEMYEFDSTPVRRDNEWQVRL